MRDPRLEAGRARGVDHHEVAERALAAGDPGGLDGVATPTGFALVIAAAAAWGIGNIAVNRAAPADPLRFMTWIGLPPARLPAGTVAPFSLLVPVFGLGFAALLLGEPLTVRTVIAAVLVVSGVLLTQRAPLISPQIAAIHPRPPLRSGAGGG